MKKIPIQLANYQLMSKQIASISWDKDSRSWVAVMAPGWWPNMLASPRVAELKAMIEYAVPMPTLSGKYPSLLGMWCSVPPYHFPGRIPKRRLHGEVVDQSDDSFFIQVKLAHMGRHVWVAVGQARWQ